MTRLSDPDDCGEDPARERGVFYGCLTFVLFMVVAAVMCSPEAQRHDCMSRGGRPDEVAGRAVCIGAQK